MIFFTKIAEYSKKIQNRSVKTINFDSFLIFILLIQNKSVSLSIAISQRPRDFKNGVDRF